MNGLVLLLIHAGATWFMVGLIWFVQVVHYALFDRVAPGSSPAPGITPDGGEGYARYQADHMRLTTWVVGPAMLVEVVTGVMLLFMRPAGVAMWMVWVGLALIGVLWLSTALLQVPMHRKLEAGFDAAAHARLVGTNWLRTAVWSARGVLVGWMVYVTAASAAGA